MKESQFKAYRERFEIQHPEQAFALSNAKTDEERYIIHNNFLAEAKEDMEHAFTNLNSQLNSTEVSNVLAAVSTKHDQQGIEKILTSLKANLSADRTDETSVVLLRPSLLATLVDATGQDIEIELHKILDSVERLSHMTDDDAIEVSLQIVGFSAAAVGIVAGAVTLYQLLMLSGSFTVSATLAGMLAATVAIVVAVAAFIILAVLIPLLYFMNKPAVCMVLLINELNGGPNLESNSLVFVDDYNRSGKPTLLTNPIPGAYYSPKGIYAYSGLFSTSKRDQALEGTSYGFKLECEYSVDGNGASGAATKQLSLAFGVENPLTSIYGGNNCYCGFDISAKEAADKTNDKNVLAWSDENTDGIKISIKCNSKGGSIAYYIARVFV